MSSMAEERKPRRARRSFTDEFKAGAVQQVVEGGRTIAQVARALDLTESALRAWVEQARADTGKGKPGALTSVEREELTRLRKEVRQLRMDREILRKAAACSTGRRSAPGVPGWLLPLAISRSVRPAGRGGEAPCPGPRGAPSRSTDLRKPEGAPRAPPAGHPGQQKARHPSHAGGGALARARRRYRCTTMSDHEQPVAANLLGREFHRGAAQPAVDRRHDRAGHTGWAAVPRGDPRPVPPLLRRMGAQRRQRPAPHAACPRDGASPAMSLGRTAPSLGSGQHLRKRGLSGRARAPRHVAEVARAFM